MINEFKGEFRFLSNFFPCEINWGGIRYPSVEHAYQASKTHYHKERIQIASLATPGQAKRAGRKLILRSDWEEVKIPIMKALVSQKFGRNKALKKLLLATGNQYIQEGNTWNDTFWGVSLQTGEGRNELGEILMQVREELSLMELKEFGTILTGRTIGKEVRENILDRHGLVTIDLTEVEIVNHGFCDEAFAKIENITEKVKFINANENIKAAIKYALLERRGNIHVS